MKQIDNEVGGGLDGFKCKSFQSASEGRTVGGIRISRIIEELHPTRDDPKIRLLFAKLRSFFNRNFICFRNRDNLSVDWSNFFDCPFLGKLLFVGSVINSMGLGPWRDIL